MDYKGQKLAEQLYFYIIIICGAIGWVVGYAEQDFLYTLYACGAGVLISSLLCVPDWPIYNRHPVKWLDEVPNQDKTTGKVMKATKEANSKQGKKK
ncbi:unnamed protein product [Chrysoparadoxa australica]